MGELKSFVVGILNFLLIISLSVAILSLVFSIVINEQTLTSLANEELQPFIEEQAESALKKTTQPQLEDQYKSALIECRNSNTYEVARQGNESIQIDCEIIKNSQPSNFRQIIKDSIVSYTMNSVRTGVDKTSGKLFYFTLALWISVALSLLLIVIIILLVGKFPFKTFGATGLIAGSPFIIIIFSQNYILSKVKEQLQNSTPPEFVNQILQSSLFQAITNLIKNLINSMALGFAALFLIGLILLLIGVFTNKKSTDRKSSSNNQNL